MIPLTSEILNNLKMENQITFQDKRQRGSSGVNFFISPSLCIELYDSKVFWVDPFKKNISFGFSKKDSLSLLIFLRYINSTLSELFIEKLKNMKTFPDTVKKGINGISPFFYEKGEYFYIKCNLPQNPNSRGVGLSKYSVKVVGEEDNFKCPYIGGVYKIASLYIKNLWSKNGATGFNLELKAVKYD